MCSQSERFISPKIICHLYYIKSGPCSINSKARQNPLLKTLTSGFLGGFLTHNDDGEIVYWHQAHYLEVKCYRGNIVKYIRLKQFAEKKHS